MKNNKKLSKKNKKYSCPRCQWPLENLLSKYVSREGNFEFFHCMNCGQDYYIEFRELLDLDKDEVEKIILKKVEAQYDYMLRPSKKWIKRRIAVKCNLN